MHECWHFEWMSKAKLSQLFIEFLHTCRLLQCYIDPVTGNRFYSKPEVFRYLRTVKNKLCTLKERKTSKDTNSRSQVCFPADLFFVFTSLWCEHYILVNRGINLTLELVSNSKLV